MRTFKEFYLSEATIPKKKFKDMGFSDAEIERLQIIWDRMKGPDKVAMFGGGGISSATKEQIKVLLDNDKKSDEEKERLRLEKEEQKKNYNLIDNNDDYMVIEPKDRFCVNAWAPRTLKPNDGVDANGERYSCWCIGYTPPRTDYFNGNYGDDAKFLIIDKKENPNLAKYAWVINSTNPNGMSELKDKTNGANISHKEVKDVSSKCKKFQKELNYYKFFTWDFDEVGPFEYGIAMVRIGKKYGHIDEDGHTLDDGELKYDWAGSFVEDYVGDSNSKKFIYTKVCQLEKGKEMYGFIDRYDKDICGGIIYEQLGWFCNGYAEATLDGKKGYIDYEGKWFDELPKTDDQPDDPNDLLYHLNKPLSNLATDRIINQNILNRFGR